MSSDSADHESADYEDGPNLVTMAMNGWMQGEPAWWLNLQQDPDTMVYLADGGRPVVLVKSRRPGSEQVLLARRPNGNTGLVRDS